MGHHGCPWSCRTMWCAATCKESRCVHGSSFQPHLPICTLWKPLLPSPRLASWAGALYPEGEAQEALQPTDMHRGRSPSTRLLAAAASPAGLVASLTSPGFSP